MWQENILNNSKFLIKNLILIYFRIIQIIIRTSFFNKEILLQKLSKF